MRQGQGEGMTAALVSLSPRPLSLQLQRHSRCRQQDFALGQVCAQRAAETTRWPGVAVDEDDLLGRTLLT